MYITMIAINLLVELPMLVLGTYKMKVFQPFLTLYLLKTF